MLELISELTCCCVVYLFSVICAAVVPTTAALSGATIATAAVVARLAVLVALSDACVGVFIVLFVLSELLISHLYLWLKPALTHSPPSSSQAFLASLSAFCVSMARPIASDVNNPAAVPTPAPNAAAEADVCERVSRWAFSMYVVISMPNQFGVH